MVDRSLIKPNMDVVASDGTIVGRVEMVDEHAIRLSAAGAGAGRSQPIPLGWVARVDRHVHLNIGREQLAGLKGGRVVSIEDAAAPAGIGVPGAAAAAGAAIGAVGAGAAGHIETTGARPAAAAAAAPPPLPPTDAPAGGAAPNVTGNDDAATPLPPIRNPAVKGARPRGNYYLPWILALLGTILLLVLLLRACEREDVEPQAGRETGVAPAATTINSAAPARPAPIVTDLTTGTIAYDLNAYLASGGTAERTFAFDRLNFRTGSSRIRREDQEDLEDIARVLAAYPESRVAVIGYTDARGSGEANVRLGFERATAVLGALAEQGINPSRMEARSRGEQDPLAAGGQSDGRAESRRTELVVLSR